MNETAKMDIREMPIGKLKPSAYNPRIDLAPGDKEYDNLKASLDRWDLVEPLVWNEQTGNLISGHQRLKICKKRGDKTVPVVVVNINETKEQILNLALNRISGSWDYEKLAEVLKEYNYEDLGITGLSDAEISRLTSDANAAVHSTLSQIDENKDVPIVVKGKDNAAEDEGFFVYLSFPEREAAEEWLQTNGFDKRFKDGERLMTVSMEG